MKFALLKYSDDVRLNVGDNIQSLAVMQHVDQDFELLDRDHLSQYDREPLAVVMNGWFTNKPENWPPSPAIVPIFFGFHITPWAAPVLARHKEYLARHAPIGCRDEATRALLTSWGIEAYVSGCATMTFPVRAVEPASPKLVLVDQTHKHFGHKERCGHLSIPHEYPHLFSPQQMFLMAHELLSFYREQAGFVVTSRIHCAMPCAAMGIPVVFTGKQDGRTDVVKQIGIPSAVTRRFPRTSLSDLRAMAPKAPSFEDKKERMMRDLHGKLQAHGIKTQRPAFAQLAEQIKSIQFDGTPATNRMLRIAK